MHSPGQQEPADRDSGGGFCEREEHAQVVAPQRTNLARWRHVIQVVSTRMPPIAKGLVDVARLIDWLRDLS